MSGWAHDGGGHLLADDPLALQSLAWLMIAKMDVSLCSSGCLGLQSSDGEALVVVICLVMILLRFKVWLWLMIVKIDSNIIRSAILACSYFLRRLCAIPCKI